MVHFKVLVTVNQVSIYTIRGIYVIIFHSLSVDFENTDHDGGMLSNLLVYNVLIFIKI